MEESRSLRLAKNFLTFGKKILHNTPMSRECDHYRQWEFIGFLFDDCPQSVNRMVCGKCGEERHRDHYYIDGDKSKWVFKQWEILREGKLIE